MTIPSFLFDLDNVEQSMNTWYLIHYLPSHDIIYPKLFTHNLYNMLDPYYSTPSLSYPSYFNHPYSSILSLSYQTDLLVLITTKENMALRSLLSPLILEYMISWQYVIILYSISLTNFHYLSKICFIWLFSHFLAW